MSLLDKLKKNSTIKSTQILSDSDFFNGSSLTNVGIPAIDIALSGSSYGGLPAGLTIVAGPRAHFKTNLCLKMVAAYLNKYDDAVCVFLDCEFGTTPGYLKSMGVSPERVLHVPIHNIEEMKFETVAQLENIDKGDHVIFLVDSIGNMASKKELEDAKEQKSVTDMTRAKAFKSLFRMITPYLTEKNIPMLCIGHTYDTQEMFSKTILSGGCVKAGTLVTMANGELKPIEQIVEGEFVKTLDGDKMVEHTWTPETLDDGNPECITLEFDDGFAITCSMNHKFLTSNWGWIEAQHLSDKDYIVTNSEATKRLVKSTPIGRHPVYEITVKDAKHYILENGIVSHNTGGYYSANAIIFLSKSQEKDGKELLGYNFKMIAEKSRYIREKSVIPLQVLFDGGIQKWSGLFEMARQIGWVEMPSSGWYTAKNPHTGEVFIERARAKDIEASDEFWEKLFANGFDEDIKLKYCLTPEEQSEQDNSSNEDE